MVNLEAIISCPKCDSYRFLTNVTVITQEYFLRERPLCMNCHYQMTKLEIESRYDAAIKRALSGSSIKSRLDD